MTFIKSISTFLIALLTVTTTFGQESKPKTKILLIGTIHFETPHTDSFELKVDDFLSTKRQNELEDLTTVLSQTKATKVMIEKPFENQRSTDSLYNLYLTGHYKLTVSEREQIGFRLGKKLKLTQINCIDKFYAMHDSLMAATAKENNQLYLLKDLGTHAKAMISDFDNQLKKGTITEVLKYINRPDQLERNLSIYLKFIAKIGAGKNFAGAESVSVWYLRNLAIYANIMTQINANDKYVILIFGQGHIPILKHLLQNNDDFEVVEVSSVLK
ncbi:hypothetical protein C8C83_0841 [Flavobacterium sp. 90]|uniref:DUF5694 domain-containing protein n=1 Tax=unclassified Flavobacterium TaxID=196869 RepID=UPI000EAF10F1|nr:MULTISPECIES: DUF5694 domain-containing protein [unclassified Flavobacterium]RKR09222.1 hypothetical protein C8C82_1140 [Flavobacterium sp. 81]TCK53006.1 hypothetical protein C8C83_0841 [Flavobacterium sp. 90]